MILSQFNIYTFLFVAERCTQLGTQQRGELRVQGQIRGRFPSRGLTCIRLFHCAHHLCKEF
jgi:hypothetical protein